MPKKIYEEINLNELIVGKDVIAYDYAEDDDKIEISVKSKKKVTICPCCGAPTEKLHNTYNRRIQIMPFKKKTTYVKAKCYKYKCSNNECEQKVIMDDLDFVSPSQVKSDELICTILAISMFMSNEGASKVLAELGIKCSNDTIKRLYDQLIIEDDPDVTEIGVDDVAIRKGLTYSTAVYDKTGRLLALLDGRDGESLKEWLKAHTKIVKVERDRASAYASAISEILPNCIQIADRFHMLQNLLEYLKDIFKAELPKDIVIQDGVIVDKPEKEIGPDSKTEKEIKKFNYDDSEPLDENGDVVKFDTTMADRNSKQYKEDAENRKKNNS